MAPNLHPSSIAAETSQTEDVTNLHPAGNDQKQELDAGALFVLKSEGKSIA